MCKTCNQLMRCLRQVLTSGQGLLGFHEVLARLAQASANDQRIALDDGMDDREEIGHAQTLQPLFGKLNQGLGPVTDQGEDVGSQGREPLLHQRLPRRLGAILCRLFQQQRAWREVHADQEHAFQEGFIHGSNDLAPLTMRTPVLLPGPGRRQPHGLSRRHHPAQGGGRTSYLRLKMETSEKLAQRVYPHAALEPERVERGDHQAGQPLPALCGFPEPGFRVTVAALYRLLQTMYAALGQAGLQGKASHALSGIVTKTVENLAAFVPQSHVGLCSEG